METKTICLASSKGGSGKTILTANIASFLNAIGKKCLMIDCDAATHGLTLLYLVEVSGNSNQEKKGLFEIPSCADLQECLKASVISVENGVDLLPATYNFTPGFDPEVLFEQNSLFDILNIMKPEYDYIFIDAQAGSDKYSRLAMKKNISDEVIIVSEYDPLSAAGIERLKQVIGEDLGYTRTWVLLNKMLPEFVDKFSEFLSITKYLTPIPWNADVVRAYAKRKLALDLEKGNVFTLSIMRVVSALLGEKIKNEIAGWSKKRSYALKAPIEKQYTNAEKELKFLLDAQHKLEHSFKKRRLAMMFAVITPFLLLPFLLYDFLDEWILEKTNILNGLRGYLRDMPSSVLLLIIAFVTFLFLEKTTFKIFDFESEKTTESYRFKRKIQLLEEQLKELESLRSSDFETIINKNIPSKIQRSIT